MYINRNKMRLNNKFILYFIFNFYYVVMKEMRVGEAVMFNYTKKYVYIFYSFVILV